MARRRTGLARARKAAGYTQEKLAEALSVDVTTVARWEAGASEPLPYKRPKLGRFLHVGREELEALLREGLINPSPPAPTPAGTDLAEHGSSSDSGRTMNEQPFVPPTTSVVVRSSSPALSETTSEWDDVSPLSRRSLPKTGLVATIFPALGIDERAQVAQATGEPRRFLDRSAIELFSQQLDASMRDDGALGPAKPLPAVLGLLGFIERCARDVPPHVRRELLSLGARGAEFAGWLYRDSHDRERAERWYHQASEWAQEAGDLPMQGYILLKKSQMAYDQRDGLRLFTLATAAHSGPWQLPFKVQAEVTQQVARGMAMLGEPLREVERYLDDARDWLARPGDTAGESPLSSHYNEINLTLQTASCYIEAGRPRRAADLYRAALRQPALSLRDQGYFLARHTVALALAGEPDDAAAQGLQAVQIVAVTESHRTTRELRRALRTLEPWRSRPAPRALREAIEA
jgi:DNA-binding XRE family transcriptional regulator